MIDWSELLGMVILLVVAALVTFGLIWGVMLLIPDDNIEITHQTVTIDSSVTSSESCYQNGQPINCSRLRGALNVSNP